MKKVNLDVIKPWISNRITEILGLEDEVVIDYTCSLLEEKVFFISITRVILFSFILNQCFIYVGSRS